MSYPTQIMQIQDASQPDAKENNCIHRKSFQEHKEDTIKEKFIKRSLREILSHQ